MADDVIVRVCALFGILRTFTAPPHYFSRGGAPTGRRVRAPRRSMPGPPHAHARSPYRARAFGGLTVSDPSVGAVPCPPLHIVQALCAPLLGPGDISERRPFAYFSVSPAALARAEDAAAAVGLGFSPSPPDGSAARIHTLSVSSSFLFLFKEVTYLGAYLRPNLSLDGRAGSIPQWTCHARRAWDGGKSKSSTNVAGPPTRRQ